MTTIVYALTPTYNKVQADSMHNNSTGGIDATSWPVSAATGIGDPHQITIGHLYNWSEGWVDDRGGMIVHRGSVHFDFDQAFASYTKITGKPAPSSFNIARATLSFMYNSAGMSWSSGNEVGSVARYGSQLNRLYYTIGDVPFAPSQKGPIAVVPPFNPRFQKTPAVVKTSEIDHVAVQPTAPPPIGRPRIRVPLAFVTKPGGYFYKVDGSSPVDGSYWIDLTGKLSVRKKFGIVFAGSPDGERTTDPDRSFMDFGAATYYNFFLNVKLEF